MAEQFGVGLSAAVLLDTTIVRAMKLLGDSNWYLPGWFEWLPRVGPEEPSTSPEAAPVPLSA